jgi:beta-RFAP synthase
MIDRPGVSVRVETATEWSASGPLADRAREFADRFNESLLANERRAYSIILENCPAEHTGLGVGTQLGMAIAKAIAIETGHGDWNAVELARRVGRGERSAIGVYGFERGGLLVEAGKTPEEPLSPLIASLSFPREWVVLLLTPESRGVWHGARERIAFTQLAQSTSVQSADVLYRIALTGILPGVASADIDLFGEAVYEFNARVGDMFATVQGGRYASPAVANCVQQLRDLGVKCVGQSSWGPTVFAIVNTDEAASLRRRLPELRFAIASGSRGCLVS